MKHDINKGEDYASPSIVPPQLILYVSSSIDLLADTGNRQGSKSVGATKNPMPLGDATTAQGIFRPNQSPPTSSLLGRPTSRAAHCRTRTPPKVSSLLKAHIEKLPKNSFNF